MKNVLFAVAAFMVSGSILAAEPITVSTAQALARASTQQLDTEKPNTPLVQLSAEKRAKLAAKTEGLAGRRFGDPDLAEQFYVNSRTGPIITRGPNRTTGTRTLSPEMYFEGLQHAAQMPRYSSATGAVTPSAIPQGTRLSDPYALAPSDAVGNWSNLGPANQGGRTRAMIIDPVTPNTMYVGGVGGGVWKSTDAGVAVVRSKRQRGLP